MDKFDAIIIGCGKIAGYFDKSIELPAYSHAQAYYSTPGLEVVAYIDVDIKKAKRLATKYFSKNFEVDYVAAIGKFKPAIISICTPDSTHFSILKEILNGPFVPSLIFVEKPICSNRDELIYLVKLAYDKNVVVLVNHSRRFSPIYRKLKKTVARGGMGKLARVDIDYYGGWKHNGVHLIDTLLFLFDDSLVIDTILGSIDTQYKNDATLELIARFKGNDAKIYFHAFDEKYYQLFDFDFKFEYARLRIENFENKIIFERKTVNSMKENVLVDGQIDLLYDKSTPMQNAMKIIAKYLKTKNRDIISSYTIDKAKKTMEVLWEGAKYDQN